MRVDRRGLCLAALLACLTPARAGSAPPPARAARWAAFLSRGSESMRPRRRARPWPSRLTRTIEHGQTIVREKIWERVEAAP